MTIVDALFYAAWVGINAVIVGAGLFTRDKHGGLGTVILLLGPVNFAGFMVLLTRRARRLRRAFDEGDPETAQRTLRSMPMDDVARAMNSALVLTMEDRWGEGCAALRAIDPAPLSEQRRVLLDNNIAWCLAHDDRADEAVAIARSTLSRARDRTVLACCHGTLGAALQIAGHPTEALESLRQAIALGGRAGHQATRRFYEGECLRALGRTDEATQAYKQAVRLAPKNQFGKLAHTELEKLTNGPYR